MRVQRFIRRNRQRRGAHMVEFAVVAPVLFILIFGLIEFGRIMMIYQVVVSASREGARKACTVTTTNDDQVKAVVRTVLTGGTVPASVANAATITITPSIGPAGSTTAPDIDPNTTITVRVAIGMQDVSWLQGGFAIVQGGNKQIRAEATMRRE